MITEDYFLRMINQLAYVLASVLRLTKLKQFDEAVEEVQASSKQLLGMDLRLLTTLSDAEFVRLLSLGDRFDLEKCVVIAELLRILGDVRSEQGEEEQGARARLTALSMFLELSRQEAGTLPGEYYEKVEGIIKLLAPVGISTRLKKKLFAYYESVGKFDKAENALFEIVEDDVPFAEEGMKFYERLRMKTDEELSGGNLPRAEIESSITDLARPRGSASARTAG
jgi:hypothetical protein